MSDENEDEFTGNIQVVCPKGHDLGIFRAQDDQSGVDMWCPECKRWVSIYNQALYHPEEYAAGFRTAEDRDRYLTQLRGGYAENVFLGRQTPASCVVRGKPRPFDENASSETPFAILVAF